jgi:polyadenylation factor subunit 2
VKCAEWHPHKSLIASCSKDATVRLWDPRTYECINTLYGHKSQVFKVSAPPGGVPALAWADRS